MRLQVSPFVKRRPCSYLASTYIRAGVGLGNQDIATLLAKARNVFVAKRWKNTRTLIIDESMRYIRT